MNFIKKNWRKFILLVYAFLAPVVSFAQGQNPPNGSGQNPPGGSMMIKNPISVNSIPDFIRTILEGIIKIGLPVIALAIVYCGFLFVKARGKPEELTKAKSALLYTLIGGAILMGAWAIAKMISATVTGL